MMRFASGVSALRRFHHVSTIGVSGDHGGTWYEDDLEKGQTFYDHYTRTKYLAEVEVKKRSGELPISIFRPGVVIGDSRTGEIDKFDGPYFFLKPIRARLHGIMPARYEVPFHLVPVDYVSDALLHIAGLDESLGGTFCLTDPRPRSVAEFVDRACEKMGTFKPFLRPKGQRLYAYFNLPGNAALVRKISRAIDLPAEGLGFLVNKVYYDTSKTEALLEGSGIRCPSLPVYCDRILDYYLRCNGMAAEAESRV